MPYTAEQKRRVVELWPKYGTAETARRTGVETRTVLRTVKAAGLTSQDNSEKTAPARAALAEKVEKAWSDFRAQEALDAGAAASRMRKEVLDASAAANAAVEELEDLTTDAPGLKLRLDRIPAVITANANLLRARVIAYGIFIDKAELLSGQATQRIALWAESEVDRDLKAAIEAMEEKIRTG